MIYDLLRRLEPYAVNFRYPGEEATKREAQLAIKAIQEIRSFLRAKLLT
ncbi:MAG: HEPN domain-containing protein [Elusimicrobia bacterium]|nr:HEPN domain-containing protein [Elusimicrobiota bacterium]